MKTVFVDVDTQIDFLFPAGALYVPGAEALAGTIARLHRFAAANNIPVLSTTDAHAENDPEFRSWPAHCVSGTVGQTKPAGTLLDRRAVVPNQDTSTRIDRVQQIIVEKTQLDLFSNPNLPWILDALAAERYVVYGVVAEICVSYALFGLLERGGRVELVEDAVRALRTDSWQETLERFRKGGGVVTTADSVATRWLT